jgi:hypothetical protein
VEAVLKLLKVCVYVFDLILDQPVGGARNLYKERLEKIQRQFQSGTGEDRSGEDSEVVEVLEKPSVGDGGKMLRPVSMDTGLSGRGGMNAGETQTYEALKERLNRMKMNMENK